MINYKFIFLLFCLFFSLTTNSFSAPIYKVEVLIFEHTESTAFVDEKDKEKWRELKETILDQNSHNNSLLVEEGEGMIKELPSSSLNLVQVRNKLEDSESYRVLYHKSWSQPVLSEEQSTAARIEVSGIVDGTINLMKKKYLHMKTDLVFNSIEGSVKLKENRRLKSKELHYFDHPLFGLLVRVVKL